MDLGFTHDELAFRAEVRGFFAKALPADLRAKMIDRGRLTRDDYIRWQRILNAQGWATINWPVEYGGTGWSPAQRYIFQEEMALAHAPEWLPFNVNMIGPILCRFGSDAQKETFLRPTANLDIWWCQGFSEPGSGSDLAGLRTAAVRDGDDYVINGQKIWTTLAQYADWMFLLARTDPTVKKQHGISFLLLDMTTPGITIRPIRSIDGVHDLNEVFFDDVRVPVANRIGEEGKGWTYAKYLLGNERTGIARVGLSKERLLQLRAVAADLTAKEMLTPAESARLSRKLAELEVDLRALELTQMRVVANALDGDGAASLLKIRGSEIQQRATELLLELAGPAGLAVPPDYGKGDHWDGREDGWRASAAPFYFSKRAVSIYGGANEIQKNIIAKTVLGL
ncbi:MULTISPECIES: acyl-CoA dehydrogenase family protein [unclassified Sphingobium]|uniref:acyl-CoA dehydrogenase family protein n=1 Tax=unclassified Sphingobium TaxID=2611147 RepID=UPI000D16DC85|nr:MULTISPECIES: acyl-CoA dehydrogenase family protein [unclassified Sphingobium]MBG6120079.1 alkylation response protein AidB-like acyl-CoA dehydrogenase [Sphingobium sp. JAI105]PSO12871.1 pimeloyl-CoA dehydrogenase large subunit [Sphingobium sp. AEW4]TWD05720.1 alkylation response protein AidB-like acyl-CoA dehydrogenase [Sphingobium sp. AEW010]TWD23273.1 alkylation response protein AidB-like acyl-CoA dehydrogenase [Sphingobium sp. AEW013]TWD25133.1 alkylation response protein AidB-like acyl